MEVKEPAIAYSQQKISIEAYLEMENASLEKHEYYKGEVFAMSGAKLPHIKITGNLQTTLIFHSCTAQSCIIDLSQLPLFYRSRQVQSISMNTTDGEISLVQLLHKGDLW